MAAHLRFAESYFARESKPNATAPQIPGRDICGLFEALRHSGVR